MRHIVFSPLNTMSFTHFKLTRPDGLTRRLKFPERPSWSVLAARVGNLFSIPVDSVAVSYVDNDGDEVTLSSQEELQDYYETSHEPDQVIKFAVHDLSAFSPQNADKPLPDTPRTSNPSGANAAPNRNPFVPPAFVVEVEDDWERLPSLGGLGMGGISLGGPPAFMPGARESPSPHAFLVEVDDSADLSKRSERSETERRESESVSTERANPASRDKGKEKAREDMEVDDNEDDDRASTTSVIADETPKKHPVHVYDVSDAEGDGNEMGSIADESNASSTAKAASPPAAPDPPLESTGEPVDQTVSLTNDVASFLNNLSSILSTHPELTEGIQNIVRHASDGSYWSAHRDALTRAANELRRSSMEVQAEAGRAGEYLRRAAEEEAGRRVTEAVNNIALAIRQMTVGDRGDRPADAGPVTSTPLEEQFGRVPFERPSSRGEPDSHRGRGGRWSPRGHPHFHHFHGHPHHPFGRHSPPSPPHVRHGPPPPPHMHHGFPPFPPHMHHGPFPPPPMPGSPHSSGRRDRGPVPPSPPPPPAHHFPHHSPPPPLSGPSPLPHSPEGPPPPPPPMRPPPEASGTASPPPPPPGGAQGPHVRPPGPPPPMGSGFPPFPPGFVPMSAVFRQPGMRRGPFFDRGMFGPQRRMRGRGGMHMHRPFPPPFVHGTPGGMFSPPFGPPPGHEDDDMMDDDAEFQDIDMYGLHSHEDTRAELEAAKEFYKAMKDRYRRERDARRRMRGGHGRNMSMDSAVPPTSADVSRDTTREDNGPPQTDSQPTAGPSQAANTAAAQSRYATVSGNNSQRVSSARGGFPALELFSVPRRANTYHGRAQGRGQAGPSAPAGIPEGVRIMQERIERRVTEMGFSDPSVARRVTEQLGKRRPTGDGWDEDDIVTSVIEELVSIPISSGPGEKRDGSRELPNPWK